LDGDGDLDIIIITFDPEQHTIAWYENIDGRGVFGDPRVVASQLYAGTVDTADWDGDGDLDIIASDTDQGVIVWYENTDRLAWIPT
jgi:hypothetical protein